MSYFLYRWRFVSDFCDIIRYPNKKRGRSFLLPNDFLFIPKYDSQVEVLSRKQEDEGEKLLWNVYFYLVIMVVLNDGQCEPRSFGNRFPLNFTFFRFELGTLDSSIFLLRDIKYLDHLIF